MKNGQLATKAHRANLEIKNTWRKIDELALGTKQGNLGLHIYCTPQGIYKDNKGLVKQLKLQLLNTHKRTRASAQCSRTIVLLELTALWDQQNIALELDKLVVVAVSPQQTDYILSCKERKVMKAHT